MPKASRYLLNFILLFPLSSYVALASAYGKVCFIDNVRNSAAVVMTGRTTAQWMDSDYQVEQMDIFTYISAGGGTTKCSNIPDNLAYDAGGTLRFIVTAGVYSNIKDLPSCGPDILDDGNSASTLNIQVDHAGCRHVPAVEQ